MNRWYDNWDALTPIFKFSADVRTLIYTTNSIESLNAIYRKLNHQRSVFPSDQALFKALYLSTFEATKGVVELSDASVGDIVVFGDIRWYVTGITETGYTLLSEKPVIKQCFRKAGYGISTSTWEESTVRAWLNDKFYNTFSEEEKALIAKTHIINADNSEYGTSGGNDTDDYIYLLSVDEADALDSSIRKCGSWDSPFHQWWWLRSPGSNTSYVTYVGKGKDGVIDPHGDIASNEYGAVRPAIRVRYSDQAVDK